MSQALRNELGLGALPLCQRPFFFVLSLTVVLGFRLTVDCFTKRPEIALRPRLPLLSFLGISLTSSCVIELPVTIRPTG